jgi:hypothetical protein
MTDAVLVSNSVKQHHGATAQPCNRREHRFSRLNGYISPEVQFDRLERTPWALQPNYYPE